MDLFEYILILTSVIFALAVAEILDGVSRLAQLPHPVRMFLPHTIWVLNLFVFVFLIWWASWEFRYVDWSFPFYAYMLIAPTLLGPWPDRGRSPRVLRWAWCAETRFAPAWLIEG